MTMRQWFETAEKDAVEYAKAYMGLTEKEGYIWGMIRTAMASVSDICIVQLQDYLNLDGSARMNFPGTMGNNWTWRAKPGAVTKALAKRIHKITTIYCRKTIESERMEL